jgi:hypothetical protein
MRILLARQIHVVDTPLRFQEKMRYRMVVHGGVEVVKGSVSTLRLLNSITGALSTFVLTVRPVLPGQVLQSAENAIVPRCGASLSTSDWSVKIAVELWRVQQALQYSVTVAHKPRVLQSFGLVYIVGPSSKSHERPAFANATVDDTPKVSNFAHRRHGSCIEIGHGNLVELVASGYSSKDQLCRMRWYE